MFSGARKSVLLTRVLSDLVKLTFLKKLTWEFPGGLVFRIPGCHCRGPGSIPGPVTEIPQAARRGQKKKKERN